MSELTFSLPRKYLSVIHQENGDVAIYSSALSPTSWQKINRAFIPFAIAVTVLANSWWIYRMVQARHFILDSSTIYLTLTCLIVLRIPNPTIVPHRYVFHPNGTVTNLKNLNPQPLPVQSIRIDSREQTHSVIVRAGYYQLEIAKFPELGQAEKLADFLRSAIKK